MNHNMLRKLGSNLGSNAIRVVGLKVTLEMWAALLLNIKKIYKAKNLFPLDKFMSRDTVYTIKHKLGNFKVNPFRIDQIIVEPSFCFSSVREIYIKDCYFKYHDFDKRDIKTIVDLGANRGMFSVMCTPFAEKIVAIEADKKFVKAIQYNITELNGFKNLEIGNYFIGNCKLENKDVNNVVDFNFIVHKYDLGTIDFLKMDIEGSEFDIMDDVPWNKIKYLSMEVHHAAGSPKTIADILEKNDFEIIMTNSQFVRTKIFDEADYIYGKNTSLVH